MEKQEIIINEMTADDGPVHMDLGNVGTNDAKMTQSDSDTSNDMSYENVCAIAWTGYTAGKRACTQGPNGSGGVCLVEKELMNGRVAEDMTKERKECSKVTGTVTGTKEALEAKAKARAIVKPDTATIAESKGISQ